MIEVTHHNTSIIIHYTLSLTRASGVDQKVEPECSMRGYGKVSKNPSHMGTEIPYGYMENRYERNSVKLGFSALKLRVATAILFTHGAEIPKPSKSLTANVRQKSVALLIRIGKKYNPCA